MSDISEIRERFDNQETLCGREILTLFTRLTTVEAERDEILRLSVEISKAESQKNIKFEALTHQLREALRTYGTHLNGFQCGTVLNGEQVHQSCTCGLTEVGEGR